MADDPQPNVLAVNRSLELAPRFWAMLALTGLGAGLAGGLLMRLLHAVQHLAWSFRAGSFVDAVARASPERRIGVAVLAGVIVAVGLTLLRLRKGGHAGDISVAIWFHAGRAPMVPTLARAVLSIVVVGLGAAVGREGAMKQAGATIAWKLAELVRLTPPQRRLLTACGAGAGMAAAYNIPLGGALFALEVLLGSISLPFALPALACSMLATAVSWLLLPMTPTYITPTYELAAPQIVWALVAGPLIGVAAVAYVRLIAWADAPAPRSPLFTVGAPIGVFLALGLASLVWPQLLGNGLDVVQLGFLGRAGALPLLCTLALLRPLATALCLRSGAPGGLFTPTMATGVLLGGALGEGWNRLLATWNLNTGSCAVIGAGAMLAAATEGPVSAVVSVIELGRHIDLLIVPIGVAAAGAMLVMRLAGAPSIYSVKVRYGARPVRRSQARLPAGVSEDFVDVSAAAHPALAAQRLLIAEHHAPPWPAIVVDERHRPVGRLTARCIREQDATRQPIELVTAADLVEPLRPVAVDALGAARLDPGVTPVVDQAEGRLIGVADRRQAG